MYDLTKNVILLYWIVAKLSSVPHVYSPVGIIPTHHCEKFLPESYFALILDANPSQPNQTKIEVKLVRLIPNTTKLRSSFCLKICTIFSIYSI